MSTEIINQLSRLADSRFEGGSANARGRMAYPVLTTNKLGIKKYEQLLEEVKLIIKKKSQRSSTERLAITHVYIAIYKYKVLNKKK